MRSQFKPSPQVNGNLHFVFGSLLSEVLYSNAGSGVRPPQTIVVPTRLRSGVLCLGRGVAENLRSCHLVLLHPRVGVVRYSVRRELNQEAGARTREREKERERGRDRERH